MGRVFMTGCVTAGDDGKEGFEGGCKAGGLDSLIWLTRVEGVWKEEDMMKCIPHGTHEGGRNMEGK